MSIFEEYVQVKYMQEIWTLEYGENEPIALTEEWLLKGGFEKRFEEDNCNLYDLESFKKNTKKAMNRGQGFFCLANFLKKEGFWIDLQSRATLKFVHQLQNLYHAITGEELNFKL